MLTDDFNVSVVNVIWKMVANKTFALDSQVLKISYRISKSVFENLDFAFNDISVGLCNKIQ